MREYPAEFNEVLKSAYPSLASKYMESTLLIISFSLSPSLFSLLFLSFFSFLGSAEKLFTQCDEYADTVKKKGQIWPLQNTLLLLCPVRI